MCACGDSLNIKYFHNPLNQINELPLVTFILLIFSKSEILLLDGQLSAQAHSCVYYTRPIIISIPVDFKSPYGCR